MRANRFTMVLLSWILLATVPGWLAAAGADERADMWRMMGSTVRADEKGDVTWFLVVALLLVLGIFLLARIYNRPARSKAARSSHKTPAPSFGEQAGAMGFRPIEVTNLRRIARRLSGGTDPVNILATGTGRQFLTADLRKRIRKREKEIALLAGMLQKLGARADHDFHEHSFVRVEADIAVWLVHKHDEETAPDEDVIVDISPIAGRLSDLSEGGTAITAAAELAAGDVVEVWSADSQYWIPPMQSGVVSTRGAAAGELSISLHFLDPPMTGIRHVIQEIQRNEQDDPEELVGGSGDESNNN